VSVRLRWAVHSSGVCSSETYDGSRCTALVVLLAVSMVVRAARPASRTLSCPAAAPAAAASKRTSTTAELPPGTALGHMPTSV
jgi:hypothetical protein